MSPLIIRLRDLRTATGFTQQQLAAKAGVRQGTVSDIELGKGRRVDLDVLERIAAALGVPPLDLFGDDRPPRGLRPTRG